MRNPIRAISMGLLFLAATARAGNLGNVTSLKVFLGLDGKKYLEVGHSGTDLGTDFASAGAYDADPVLLPCPDDSKCMATWTVLQNALACQCVSLYAIKGYVPAAGTVMKTPDKDDPMYDFYPRTLVIATDYRFRSL